MRAGLYLGLVQWLFALTWTIYVAFLPQLTAGAGIDRKWVVWLLLLDQILFTVMDLALGVAADRVAAGMRRLSGPIVTISTLSCLAFLLLPHTASPSFLIGLVVLWSVTSSALRAPPMVLIGQYAPPSAAPRLAQLSMVGLGVAGACAPALTSALRGMDPRLPFALAGIGLLAAVAAMRWCERNLAATRAAATAKSEAAASDRSNAVVWGGRLVLVMLLLGLGFQIHTSLNSMPAYLRTHGATDLTVLMPLFWVAFALAMAGSNRLLMRFGPWRLLLLATVLGSAALAGVSAADRLGEVIMAQVAAGAAWALVLACALPAAIAAGRSGREGRNTGLVFSMMALAAFLRLALVAADLNTTVVVAQSLPWLPAALWGAASLFCALGAWREMKVAG